MPRELLPELELNTAALPSLFISSNPAMPLAELEYEERSRKVRYYWGRKPDGKTLPTPGPCGLRTPEGYVWGHTLESFYWVQVIPGVPCMRVWSRSMLKDYGEDFSDDDFDHPEPQPHVRRPWPVLSDRRVLRYLRTLEEEDTGSDHEEGRHITLKPAQMRDLLTTKLRMESLKIENHEDPELELSQFVVPNNSDTPVISPFEKPYIELWATEFRPVIKRMFADGLILPLDSVGRIGKKFQKVVDDTGIAVVSVAADNALGNGQTRSLLDFVDPKAVERLLAIEANSGRVPDLCVHRAKCMSSVVTTSTVPSGGTSIIDAETNTGSRECQVDLEITSFEADNLGRDFRHRAEFCLKDDSRVALESPFRVDDLPKLEEFIPEQHFPDILIAHDAEQSSPRGYKRIFPRLPRDSDSASASTERERVAHLYTHLANALGEGHHSYVQRGALTLPSPLYGRSRTGQVTVAVKTAQARAHARRLLRQEGVMYSRFPRHIQQEYSGYQVIRPIHYPVPVSPVVPKFYGYYAPVDDDGKVNDEGYYDASDDDDYPVGGPSPILLIEECGDPIDSSELSLDDRCECYSHVVRLHHAGFVQNSFYVRNILVQPGPLTRPPAERSREIPSFRIIDFGRGQIFDEKELEGLSEDAKQVALFKKFQEAELAEDASAHEALGLDFSDY